MAIGVKVLIKFFIILLVEVIRFCLKIWGSILIRQEVSVDALPPDDLGLVENKAEDEAEHQSDPVLPSGYWGCICWLLSEVGHEAPRKSGK